MALALPGMKLAALLLLATGMLWADHHDSKREFHLKGKSGWEYPSDSKLGSPLDSPTRMPEPSVLAELALGSIFCIGLVALRKRT